MVLGADKIVHMITGGVEVEDAASGRMTVKPLIEHLGSDQIEQIEGTTVDLRLGAVYRPVGRASLMRDKRITPEIEKLMDIKDSPDGVYLISGGEGVDERRWHESPFVG